MGFGVLVVKKTIAGERHICIDKACGYKSPLLE